MSGIIEFPQRASLANKKKEILFPTLSLCDYRERYIYVSDIRDERRKEYLADGIFDVILISFIS
jgi:hypothetical protein